MKTNEELQKIEAQIADIQAQKAVISEGLRGDILTTEMKLKKYRSDYGTNIEVAAELATNLIKRKIESEKMVHSFDPDTLQHSLKDATGNDISFNDFVNGVLSDAKLIDHTKPETSKPQGNETLNLKDFNSITEYQLAYMKSQETKTPLTAPPPLTALGSSKQLDTNDFSSILEYQLSYLKK